MTWNICKLYVHYIYIIRAAYLYYEEKTNAGSLMQIEVEIYKTKTMVSK